MAHNNNIYASDMQAFVERAFASTHSKSLDPDDRYIECVCDALSDFASGKTRRLLVNLPGRHLKTFMCCVCLTAYLLMMNPHLKIMIVAYDVAIAEDIVRLVRSLMSKAWYRRCCKTRIARTHSRKHDFETTAGGRVRAVPINNVTGKGGEVVLFDDPHNVNHWDNEKKKNQVIDAFSTLMTRGDLGEKTQVAVIGHRVAEDDLSAHIMQRGDFKLLRLPYIAPETMNIPLGSGIWRLRKGDTLRPKNNSKESVEVLRREHRGSPFPLHFQQGLGPQEDEFKIELSHFPFCKKDLRGWPHVISVDTAGTKKSKSRNVAHVYAIDVDKNRFVLVRAFAKRCGFRTLQKKIESFAKGYGVSAVLIENTARGPTLIEELQETLSAPIVPVKPVNSKGHRLRKFTTLLREKKLSIVRNDATEKAVAEIVDFPNGKNDDHVDAATQFLRYAVDLNLEDFHPRRPRNDRAFAALSCGRISGPVGPAMNGIAVSFYSGARPEVEPAPSRRSPYDPHNDSITYVCATATGIIKGKT